MGSARGLLLQGKRVNCTAGKKQGWQIPKSQLLVIQGGVAPGESPPQRAEQRRITSAGEKTGHAQEKNTLSFRGARSEEIFLELPSGWGGRRERELFPVKERSSDGEGL